MIEMSIEKFWLFDKYKENIEITQYIPIDFMNMALQNVKLPCTNLQSELYTNFDWSKISTANSFNFSYPHCEKEVKEILAKSDLLKKDDVFIETMSDLPIIKVKTDFFIEHWEDFIDANGGLGSMITSTDFEYVIEFTDDAEYMAYCNFRIGKVIMSKEELLKRLIDLNQEPTFYSFIDNRVEYLYNVQRLFNGKYSVCYVERGNNNYLGTFDSEEDGLLGLIEYFKDAGKYGFQLIKRK